MVDMSSEHWLWTGSLTHQGYGRVRIKLFYGWKAHRVAWLLTHGTLPEPPLNVLHDCDIRHCVRHLYAGTIAQNSADMMARSRWGPGVKLDYAKAKEIREGGAKGIPGIWLAAFFGVSEAAVSRVLTGRSWR